MKATHSTLFMLNFDYFNAKFLILIIGDNQEINNYTMAFEFIMPIGENSMGLARMLLLS